MSVLDVVKESNKTGKKYSPVKLRATEKHRLDWQNHDLIKEYFLYLSWDLQ